MLEKIHCNSDFFNPEFRIKLYRFLNFTNEFFLHFNSDKSINIHRQFIYICGFRFSYGWFSNFKQRFNIKQYTKHGEASSVSEENVKAEITKEHNPNDIINSK